ncbi:hypothetical protein ACET6W_08255 [Aeromonas veronii]|uniref:hypothetical protein n=1 Tax=Aeromonas veronii TaxID=654 RepID=UPI00058A13AA|nr:hypothetical protein [Aeromonas veronii]
MEIVGTILDADDIVLSTRKRNDIDVQIGTVKFMTTKPTAVIEFSLSEDQVKANYHVELANMVGRKVNLQLEYVDNSYAGNGGLHKTFNGFRLFALPSPEKKGN